MKSARTQYKGDKYIFLVDLSPVSDKYLVTFRWNLKNHQYDLIESSYIPDVDLIQDISYIDHSPFKLTKKLKREILFHSDWNQLLQTDEMEIKRDDIEIILKHYASFKMKIKCNKMGKEQYIDQCIQEQRLLE